VPHAVDGGYTVSDPLAMEYSEKDSVASLVQQALILLEDAESYDLHALGASGADAASIEIPIDLDVHHHVRRNTCLGRFRRAISNFIRAKRGSYIASNPGSSSTHWTLARGNKHETEGRSVQILRTNSHGMMPLGALQLGQKFLHHPKRDLGHHPQGVFQKWEISF
jgi:hypothetical protein